MAKELPPHVTPGALTKARILGRFHRVLRRDGQGAENILALTELETEDLGDGRNKIYVIKAVRERTGAGLREAKDAVDYALVAGRHREKDDRFMRIAATDVILYNPDGWK